MCVDVDPAVGEQEVQRSSNASLLHRADTLTHTGHHTHITFSYGAKNRSATPWGEDENKGNLVLGVPTLLLSLGEIALMWTPKLQGKVSVLA